ncbi:MAG: response regulator [Chitinophagaceae bacterium]|nr:response regulator [Chitinophagaceae bacterium]
MKSILLIEDDPNILENLVEYLEMEGFRIFSANTAKKGIELAAQIIPDLIICDTPKPGIDGYEVLRFIVNTTDTCEIPFIFCTTLCQNFYKTEAYELGADGFIIKPFELEKILQLARKCMKHGSKRQKYML